MTNGGHLNKPPTSLVGNSAIIFAGNMVANVSNYAYNIIMARFLGPELFASLVALLATMTIVGIPAMAILLGFTKFAADLESEQAPGKLKYLWLSALKIIGVLGLILAAITIVFAEPITQTLNIHAPLPFILLMISIPIGLLAAVNRGIVQGLERFWWYGSSIGGEGITKVIFGLLFVWLGYELVGATGAVLVASVIAFAVLLPPLWPLLAIPTVQFPRRQLLRFSAFTLFVTTAIILFLNVDVIAAKAFLSPEAAGRYAAASTIAKIIPYAVSAVVSAMLPRIAQLVTKGERHTQVLLEAVGVTLLGSLILYAFYLLAPTFILNLLYGSLYLDSASLLAVMGGAMVLFAISNVLLTYFLSTKDARVSAALIVSILGLFVFVSLWHRTPEQLSMAILASNLLLLGTSALTYLWVKRAPAAALLGRAVE